MAARKRTPTQTVRNAGSWLAILAASTLGLDASAATVHAEVRIADAQLPESQDYRLIVQSYDAAHAKPVGSLQRSVTAAELRDGVKISLLELRQADSSASAGKPIVVAWLEAGKPDLEFDGRMARPAPDSFYGSAARGPEASVQITLRHKA